MCEELAAGTARLVDVREPRETAKGRLHGALLFPLSEMTEGVAPPMEMRPDGTTYYLYYAQGVRVHRRATCCSAGASTRSLCRRACNTC